MRAETLLNTCVAAMRLEGCGSEAIAFMLVESAVDALTATGLRPDSLERGVDHLVSAMQDRVADLRAVRNTPNLMLVAVQESA
ncbi:ABC-type transporter Mla maintaining outer membrane lipid asymmetry ATPase subunit MlaF [Rhodoblastus acidophilus]|uniref:hypothetical protein n=1 Tax=Rhodoblastus acidophilus TaxID=1074 RepID=UPI001608BC71|nr:hypothetical protein [Rhodoblastus acidophilus]MCW2284020.1 ABC-type transporter Mla maintaining outer membrane lipid asymmetry ATPase subunit MlaF [Rhodoblastus acidophilus]MCW2332716.1 ABC-type transporter Mla maintaining outer membrane lipid asymmetry ATPase subunit MlaF [Rhodoblastus acidophilus]